MRSIQLKITVKCSCYILGFWGVFPDTDYIFFVIKTVWERC